MQDMQGKRNQDRHPSEERNNHRSQSLAVTEDAELAADLSPQSLPTIVSLEADLFFAMRLGDVISAIGGQSIIVETPAEFVTAVDRYFPVLTFVDLKTSGDWKSAIRRCKLRPHTRHIPIYAFGSHVEVETLKAARQAGADHAWARSKMMEELVSVVERHVHPPVQYVQGWDGELSTQARAGIEEFNRGKYYAQHELLEEAWIEEKRPIRQMYQGILQVGVAFYQIEEGNWAGALKMFRCGLPRLRMLPPVSQGVEIARFGAAAAAIHEEITDLGPDHVGQFDRSRFPKISLAPKRDEQLRVVPWSE